MVECHVCNRPAKEDCPACGLSVCSEHRGVNRHNCSEPSRSDVVSGDQTEVRIENSVASVNIDGEKKPDADTDVKQLERLAELKRRMDTDASSDPSCSVLLTKALEQASELKTAAADSSTDREELVRRIDRLDGVIEDLDDVSGQDLAEVGDSQAILQNMGATPLSDEERMRLRDAVASLEDEIHTLL